MRSASDRWPRCDLAGRPWERSATSYEHMPIHAFRACIKITVFNYNYINVMKTHVKKTNVKNDTYISERERGFTKEREDEREKHIQCP